MTVSALGAEEALLVLKIAFLVLLYGFILLVARSATRDLRGAPQESIVLGAREAAELRAAHGVSPARLRVVRGPGLPVGRVVELDRPTVVGRDDDCGLRLDGDEFASAHHARLEPTAGGVRVVDLGSTNGTFVNGERVRDAEVLRRGDILRVGTTELEVVR
ncbi:MAG TPA: FHA domain-containing protein [Gaiellaceae bacterium]|nr:FHA domain-containing protein [Gaiellaceae bacterium]